MQKKVDIHLQSSQDIKGAKQGGENCVNLVFLTFLLCTALGHEPRGPLASPGDGDFKGVLG